MNKPKSVYEQPTQISYRFNDFTFWYPLLKRIGMRTPESRIVYTDVELGYLVDGEVPVGYDYFMDELGNAASKIGFPCFLRTGQLSNKHGWERSCYLADPKQLSAHVFDLVETSFMANIAGLPFPYSTWVVRKLLPTTPLFHAFHGHMPITKEIRFFVSDGKIQCYHPYWPAGAFENQHSDEWKSHIEELQVFSNSEISELSDMAAYTAQFFEGYWSVDFLKATDGKWWLTDMALGARSYHFPDCKFDKDGRG